MWWRGLHERGHAVYAPDYLAVVEHVVTLALDSPQSDRHQNARSPNPLPPPAARLETAGFFTFGGVHYRQPALQMAREVLNEVGGNRLDKHRLMDYNNHPDTALGEIHNLLDTAQAPLEARLHH